MREITSEQMAEWLAYHSIEPFGFEVENFRSGMIAATVANFSGNSKRTDFRPSDFSPSFKRPMSVADQIKAAFGIKR